MGRIIHIAVEASARGRRLDVYLADQRSDLDLSRSRIQALIREDKKRKLAQWKEGWPLSSWGKAQETT